MKKHMELFEEAKKSKVLFHGTWSTMILFLMLFVGQFVGGGLFLILGTMFLGIERAFPLLEDINVLLWLSFFPMIPLFFWVKVVEKRTISSLGLKKDQFLRKFLTGFGIGFLMFSGVVFLMFFFGIITLDQGIQRGLQFLPSIALILPGWIVQSSTEEILTRGWLMHVLGARHKPFIGFMVSSMIFGVLHRFNPGINILSILNIVIVGFLFGLYVIYTQDVWGVCGMNAAWNFSQGTLFGFRVSGLEANEASLLRFKSQGSAFLTGGEFGPEASFFTTVVLSLVIIILLFKLKEQKVDSEKI